jgi:hypothetical protein
LLRSADKPAVACYISRFRCACGVARAQCEDVAKSQPTHRQAQSGPFSRTAVATCRTRGAGEPRELQRPGAGATWGLPPLSPPRVALRLGRGRPIADGCSIVLGCGWGAGGAGPETNQQNQSVGPTKSGWPEHHRHRTGAPGRHAQLGEANEPGDRATGRRGGPGQALRVAARPAASGARRRVRAPPAARLRLGAQRARRPNLPLPASHASLLQLGGRVSSGP